LKNLAAIFSVFVMMLCSSGFYVAWYISLQFVRNSQKAIIAGSGYHKDKLARFVLAKKDFKTNSELDFNDENEFEYKSQMYDVIDQKAIGDSVYINCISDTEEDNLKNIALHQIIRSGNNTSGRELPILNFRLDHYTNVLKTEPANFPEGTIGNLFKNNNCAILSAPHLTVFPPPPWLS
jgi:hypothetical protein